MAVVGGDLSMDLTVAECERCAAEDIECVPDVVTGESVLECLRSIVVPHNEDRKNVKGEDTEWVRSITLGALSRSHAPARVSTLSLIHI